MSRRGPVDVRAAAGYVSRMRPWPLFLLAACGAASSPAPAPDGDVQHGAAAVPHAEALAHLGITAEVPAGFEARIVNAESIRLDRDGLTIGLTRHATIDLPTVAAFVAKGYYDETAKVLSSEEWEGGWTAVFSQPPEPVRIVHGVIRAGEDDVTCVAVEDEITTDTVEVATRVCRSVRPK